MKIILDKRYRDFTRTAGALVECILERDVVVTETMLAGKWQYDFFVDGESLDITKDLKREIMKLKGTETFLACGNRFYPSEIPGATRHPEYPVWYSTELIQIPETIFDESMKLVECKYCDKLHRNKFIARTQMAIAMLTSGIPPEAVKDVDYNYSAINMVVNCCVDPSDIHLEEAKGYHSALLIRQKLSGKGIASMIHPSGKRPVVAYISNLKLKKLKESLIGMNTGVSADDLSLVELGLEEGEGLIPIDANF